MKKENKDFICTYHRQIIQQSKIILKNIDKNSENYQFLQEIIDNAKLAMKCGKSMEKRLYSYRNAIEELGFKRTYVIKHKRSRKAQ